MEKVVDVTVVVEGRDGEGGAGEGGLRVSRIAGVFI